MISDIGETVLGPHRQAVLKASHGISGREVAGWHCAGHTAGSGTSCSSGSDGEEPTALVPVGGGSVEAAGGWTGLTDSLAEARG